MNDKPLIYLFISVPADDDWEKERTRVEYVTLSHTPTDKESLLLTACTEPTFFYTDEYNTRGGGTKSAFADYMTGRYLSDGSANWRARYLTPALTNIDSFWHDEIVARWPKMPKHDVMVIAPEIKECYDLGADYIERLDNMFFEWKKMVEQRKLSRFEMDVLALHIDDFRDPPSESSESSEEE